MANGMHSMKKDLKSANVNFEVVKYVADDCLTNIKKKVHPGWVYFEIGVKKLQFEKNDFEIYEPDFWEKINFETCAELFPKGVFQEYFEPLYMFLMSILHEEGSFLHFWHLFTSIMPFGVFIFYWHSQKKKSIHQLLYFGDMFLNGISLDLCKKPRNIHFDLNSVFSLSYKISFVDLSSLFMERITNLLSSIIYQPAGECSVWLGKLRWSSIVNAATLMWIPNVHISETLPFSLVFYWYYSKFIINKLMKN